MINFGFFKISRHKEFYRIEIPKKKFEKFYSDFGKVLFKTEKIKTKKKIVKKIVKDEKKDRTEECAIQLMNAYNKARKKFRGKNVGQFTKSSSQFQYFLKTIPILERHKVGYKKFIESQIHGLSFVDGGKGVFPSPNHLCTITAEDRLMDFVGTRSEENSVKLTKFDRETPLGQNPGYVGNRRRVLDGIATLQEAYRVRELQRLRLDGDISDFVEDYIKELENSE